MRDFEITTAQFLMLAREVNKPDFDPDTCEFWFTDDELTLVKGIAKATLPWLEQHSGDILP